jgi:hypothetical protein
LDTPIDRLAGRGEPFGRFGRGTRTAVVDIVPDQPGYVRSLATG